MNRTCESCIKDISDCTCDNCICGPCVSAGCGCMHSAEDALDNLLQRAAVPNLASLFKAGVASGVITPAANYQNT